MRLSVYGTFDVANYGDLLFPAIVAQRLGDLYGSLDCRSPRGGPAVWPDTVSTSSSFDPPPDDSDGVLLGGGNILHALPWNREVYAGAGPLDGLLAYPSLWLGAALRGAELGVPLVWNAPGVPGPFSSAAAPLVAAVVEASAYVSVRDERSAEFLAEAGAPEERIAVVPDSGWEVHHLWSDEERAAVRRVVLGADHPQYLAVHVNQRYGAASARDLARALDTLQLRTGLPTAFVPIGPVHGDDQFATEVADLMQRPPLAIAPADSLRTIAAVIAGADAYVGSSMHGAITAAAAGRPTTVVAHGATKFEGLMAQLGPAGSSVAAWDEVPERIEAALSSTPSGAPAAPFRELDKHWSQVVAHLRSKPASAGQKALLDRVRTLGDNTTHYLAPYATLLRPTIAGAIAAERTAARLAAQRLEEARREREAAGDDVVEATREVDRLQRKVADAEARSAQERQALERALAEIEQRLERVRQEGQAARGDAAEAAREVDRQQQKIADAEARSAQERQARERAQTELERITRKRSVKAALWASRRAMPLLDRFFAARQRLRSLKRRADTRLEHERTQGRLSGRRRRATGTEQRELQQHLVDILPPCGRTTGPRISILILNRSGAHHLRRCMPALLRTRYDNLEIIVVDNASEDDSVAYLESLDSPHPLRIVRNATNVPFSVGNNQAATLATGELLLLLNNDVEPMEPTWLARMVETLLETPEVVAVGARLVYPSRPGLDNSGDAEFPDLSLQHRGIHFVDTEGVPRARNFGVGEDPLGAEAQRAREVPAATAACLLLRTETWEAIGGLDEAYHYGTEDVDLCIRLRRDGGVIRYEPTAALWHHEYGTQNAAGREVKRRNRLVNRARFVDTHAVDSYRTVFRDRVLGAGRWSNEPLTVAITVTKDDPDAGYGDYYTAHELGNALASTLGWNIVYVERYRDRWYDLDASIDVLVVLLDAYDLRRAPRSIVSVAWIRNWTERWIGRDAFDDYDLVLASSTKSVQLIEERTAKVAHLFPLATNPDRFRPRPQARGGDVLFPVNYWDQDRGVVASASALSERFEVTIHGKNWEKVPTAAPFDRGPIPYDELPTLYPRFGLVVDDTAHHALPYGAVNSRVFDALAAGTLVVTDNRTGSEELFDGLLPVYEDPTELTRLCSELLDDDARRDQLVETLRRRVLAAHTYRDRAEEFRQLLLGYAEAERFSLRVGAPRWDEVQHWGDYHFARDIQRQLERRGHPTRIHLLDEWEQEQAARDDVVIHLFGLSRGPLHEAQTNVLWIISHPELVNPQLVDGYDLAFAASRRFADELDERCSTSVRFLGQATEPARFFPEPTGPEHELLFVANSRKVQRRIIRDLLPTDLDLAVYGREWTPELLPPRYLRGQLVPNTELRRYYSSAKVVLNDHWPDMAEQGFISNRIYDALACGAVVVSDEVDGIDEAFDGVVITYRDRDDLQARLRTLLADPDERERRGRRGRAVVTDRHTFATRIDELLGSLEGR